MLRDVVYELNEMLETSVGQSDDYRAGMFHVAGVLYHQLETFEIDQSEWPRPMINPETWYLGGSK
ncbi:MAG: hypothetical protein V4808_11875 [Pseudomonadota bacterium]